MEDEMAYLESKYHIILMKIFCCVDVIEKKVLMVSGLRDMMTCVPGAGTTGRDNYLRPTNTVGCNYLSLPLIPASGTLEIVRNEIDGHRRFVNNEVRWLSWLAYSEDISDSKVHMANMGPPGSCRAPCWPLELCYQGLGIFLLTPIYHVYTSRPTRHQ